MNVETAWRALREEDAAVAPPAAVDEAVMASWSATRLRRTSARLASRVRVAWAACAAALLIAALLVWRAAPSRPPEPAPVVLAPAPPVIMTLAVDPLFDTEPLQIVRVRMPRAALRTLGVALVEPEAEGLVDVDVLVGGDGLPRDIRRVRAVLGTEQEELIR